MENTLEIYFRDFLPETQGAILETAGIQDPKDANWDLIPITFRLKPKKEAAYDHNRYGNHDG